MYNSLPRINDDYYMTMHPFGFALSGVSEEETRDVELVHLFYLRPRR